MHSLILAIALPTSAAEIAAPPVDAPQSCYERARETTDKLWYQSVPECVATTPEPGLDLFITCGKAVWDGLKGSYAHARCLVMGE